MNSVYDELELLVQQRENLNRRGGILKYDARRKVPEAVKEYDMIVKKYKQVESELQYIEDNYRIDYIKLAYILTKHTGLIYKPRIFRETYVKGGEVYRTGRFVGCYLNKRNKFFEYKSHEIEVSIDETDFNELIKSLEPTKSLLFSSSEECSFRPLVPKWYIEPINFTKLFIYGKYRFDDMITRDFVETVYPMVKNELQRTIIEENNFGK